MKACLLGIIFLFTFSVSMAQETDIRAHDPVLIKEGDTYYMFCTGLGISMHSSPDMISWTKEKPVFDKSPDWVYEVVPNFRYHFWAPDIHFYNGKYYLYYSVSSFGKNTSAIGLVTNTTLNPDDANYKWEDQGMVVQSIPGRDLFNAIDPNVIEDEEGYPWMTFGSFWSGIKLFKLIPNRNSPAKPEEWYTIARRDREVFTDDRNAGNAAIEAPFIFKKDSMYYLFVSWDYCCKGEQSTYKVVVGRSERMMGPYLDKTGLAMAKGGGSIVIDGGDKWAGAGHNSAYQFDGQDYFVFHAYDLADEGKPKLKIASMSWDAEGWPIVERPN